MPPASSSRTILIAVASPPELHSLGRPLGFDPDSIKPWTRCPTASGCDIVLTGVAKANAAGAVARILDPDRHVGVLNVGIAGVLPREHPSQLKLGSSVLSARSVFGDEGLLTPAGFEMFSDLGFPLIEKSDHIDVTPAWRALLEPLVDVVAPIATVSTCSGTDALASEVRDRTGAVAEACEGAACGLSALRLGCAFAEIRVISNTTGRRDAQVWDLQGALSVLGELVGRAELPDRLL